MKLLENSPVATSSTKRASSQSLGSTLDTSTTVVPSERSRSPKRKSSTSSRGSVVDDKSPPLSDDDGQDTDVVPTRTELNRVIGLDMQELQPLMEIGKIPCAGVRISHGPLEGRMAWRLVVSPDGPSVPTKSRPAAVAVNFILDDESAESGSKGGNKNTYVPADALAVLGYTLRPGTKVTLRVQGIPTRCVVARPDEAGRIGESFLSSGGLTYYFDPEIVAPVLYDGSLEHRPSGNVPRTIRVEDLPRLWRSWFSQVLSALSFSRQT